MPNVGEREIRKVLRKALFGKFYERLILPLWFTDICVKSNESMINKRQLEKAYMLISSIVISSKIVARMTPFIESGYEKLKKY